MVRVSPATLEAFVEAVCRAAGCPEKTARAVAASLVLADRCGHVSHGVFRIGQYVDLVDRGALDPMATPTTEAAGNGTALVDGHAAFGQRVGRVATEELCRLADGGIGAVGITNVAHLGRIGEWAQRVTDEGYLFVALVKGSTQSVAPPRSADRCFSTNPIAFGVPTFGALPFPLVVDVATSQVAHGKIRTRASNGEPLPEGWAVDDDGDPLLDATAFAAGDGAILPLGGSVAGHKGFGLGVAVELFAAILGDTPVIGRGDATGNAAAFVAVDPRPFLSVADIEARIGALATVVRDAEYFDDENTGMLPGEPEYRAMLDADAQGVAVDEGTGERLRSVASRFGLETRLPAALRGGG